MKRCDCRCEAVFGFEEEEDEDEAYCAVYCKAIVKHIAKHTNVGKSTVQDTERQESQGGCDGVNVTI